MNNTTTGNLFWRRLKKNKGALAGIVVIILAFILFIFAYLVAPDNSPYANTIIPEIGSKKPGFSIQLLKVKKERDVVNTGFFSAMLNGREGNYSFVPLTSYQKISDSIIIQKFVDEGVSERQSYHASQLADEPVVRKKYFAGTDKFGRDILSRLIIGIRVSLSVGFIAVLISLTIGILLG